MRAGKKLLDFLRGQPSKAESDPGKQPQESESQIIVRSYRRRDREDVLQIAVESFGGVCLDENIEEQFGTIAQDWQEHKRDAIAYDLANNYSDALVAEVDGRVAGFVCSRLHRQRAVGHVANLAVAPEFQGIGVGKALMSAVLDHFRDSGMLYARIETLEQNPKAQNFYPSLGFKEVGRQVFYFMDL